MSIYRVKLSRIVRDEVVVFVEAESSEDIMGMDDEARERLVTHADNVENWDGDTVGQEVVEEVHLQYDSVGNHIFKLRPEKKS